MVARAMAAAPERGAGAAFERRMGTACILLAIGGFVPSYWLPMANGALDLPIAVHVHGALFLGWLMLFRVQASLIAMNRVALHRQLGRFAVALAIAMPCAVFVLQTIYLPRFDARGFHMAARGFAWINVSDMLVFVGLVAAALFKVRRRDMHKALMLAATVSLMAVPIGRGLLALAHLFQLLPPGKNAPPPLSAAYLPHFLSWLLLVPAMLHDRAALGRVRTAYPIALGVMILQMITLAWIGRSAAWDRTATWLFA